MPTYPTGLTPSTDQVRAMLGPTIGPAEVSDALLALRGDIDSALRWVVQEDPNLATRTTDEIAQLQRAVALYAASTVAPFIPTMIRDADDSGHETQWQPIDWSRISDALMSQASDLLLSITQPAVLPGLRPHLFTVAKSRRRGY